jgi:hypothetical protein
VVCFRCRPRFHHEIETAGIGARFFKCDAAGALCQSTQERMLRTHAVVLMNFPTEIAADASSISHYQLDIEVRLLIAMDGP